MIDFRLEKLFLNPIDASDVNYEIHIQIKRWISTVNYSGSHLNISTLALTCIFGLEMINLSQFL